MGCFAWFKINDDDDYNAFEYVMMELLGFSFMCFYFYSVYDFQYNNN